MKFDADEKRRVVKSRRSGYVGVYDFIDKVRIWLNNFEVKINSHKKFTICYLRLIELENAKASYCELVDWVDG